MGSNVIRFGCFERDGDIWQASRCFCLKVFPICSYLTTMLQWISFNTRISIKYPQPTRRDPEPGLEGSVELPLCWSINSLTLQLLNHYLVVQTVKNLPAMQETWVWSLGWEDPLEEGMVTHSSILAWSIPMDRGAWWAIQSMGSQRVGCNWRAQNSTGTVGTEWGWGGKVKVTRGLKVKATCRNWSGAVYQPKEKYFRILATSRAQLLPDLTRILTCILVYTC